MIEYSKRDIVNLFSTIMSYHDYKMINKNLHGLDRDFFHNTAVNFTEIVTANIPEAKIIDLQYLSVPDYIQYRLFDKNHAPIVAYIKINPHIFIAELHSTAIFFKHVTLK